MNTVNGPDGLPADETARLDQIHANVTKTVHRLAGDVAISLRIDHEQGRPEQIGQTLAGQFMAYDLPSLATLCAGAFVLLAQKQNSEQGTTAPIPLLDGEDGKNPATFEQRARDYCRDLIELMFRHGLILTSVLDVGLYDPVTAVEVAQGLHFNLGLTRYQCTAVPPQDWTVA